MEVSGNNGTPPFVAHWDLKMIQEESYAVCCIVLYFILLYSDFFP